MKTIIYKEDMEFIEKALRHEVELLRLMNHDGLLWYDLLTANRLLNRWLELKQVGDYKDINYLN